VTPMPSGLRSPRVQPLRGIALLLAVPLLVSGCGGGDAPARVRTDPGPTCTTEGTVKTQAAPSLRAAVAPFRESGQTIRISEKLTGTATVQLKEGRAVAAVITLVHTGDGWAATTVARC
jgi:hypothetical protein